MSHTCSLSNSHISLLRSENWYKKNHVQHEPRALYYKRHVVALQHANQLQHSLYMKAPLPLVIDHSSNTMSWVEVLYVLETDHRVR